MSKVDQMSEPGPPSSTHSRLAPPKIVLPAGPLTATTIRVLIADGQPLFRDRIRKVLAARADFAIAGETGDGLDAVRSTLASQPDVLLLDPSIPELSGLEVLRALRRADVNVRTILLAAGLDPSVLVEMLQLGARGCVSRSISTELLSRSIRKVNGGELWFGRRTTSEVVRALSAATSAVLTPAWSNVALTPREREILTLLVEGDTNKGIAQRLSLGPDTVKHHLTSIFKKTGMSGRLELALFARHHHLVDAGRK
jgi:two-component system, NarL family, nitrate/nitrite response regulator NarL